jgi:hypothetical protein
VTGVASARSELSCWVVGCLLELGQSQSNTQSVSSRSVVVAEQWFDPPYWVPGRAASVIVERSSPRCSELTKTTSAATSSVVTLLATLSELARLPVLSSCPRNDYERAVKFSRPLCTRAAALHGALLPR